MLSLSATLPSGAHVSLPSPISMQVDSAYDIPADSLEVTFPIPLNDVFRSYASIQADLDGSSLFDGPIDEQLLEKSRNGYLLSIRARSKAAILLDNEALPQAYVWSRLTDLVKICAAQYGFSSVLIDRNPVLSYYSVPKGRSEWQAIEGFCRQAFGIRPYIVGNSIAVKPRRPARTITLGGSHGLPLLSLSIQESRYGVISKIVLKNPATQLYDTAIYNPKASDWGIRRKRYVSPPNEWNGALQAGADRMIRDSMIQRVTISVAVPGLIPVAVGDRALLEDPASPFDSLSVFNVSHRLSSSGASTALSLVLPDYLD